MGFTIPQPLKIEHDELHDELRHAIAMGGRTGEAAREVARRLHPHFLSEEEYALPPLGLLVALTSDGDGSNALEAIRPADAADAIAMADRLGSELPRMLAEHRDIVTALDSLSTVALEEGHGPVARFAEKLILHARTEEEVLYPATILLGRYLKLRSQVQARNDERAAG